MPDEIDQLSDADIVAAIDVFLTGGEPAAWFYQPEPDPLLAVLIESSPQYREQLQRQKDQADATGAVNVSALLSDMIAELPDVEGTISVLREQPKMLEALAAEVQGTKPGLAGLATYLSLPTTVTAAEEGLEATVTHKTADAAVLTAADGTEMILAAEAIEGFKNLARGQRIEVDELEIKNLRYQVLKARKKRTPTADELWLAAGRQAEGRIARRVGTVRRGHVEGRASERGVTRVALRSAGGRVRVALPMSTSGAFPPAFLYCLHASTSGGNSLTNGATTVGDNIMG